MGRMSLGGGSEEMEKRENANGVGISGKGVRKRSKAVVVGIQATVSREHTHTPPNYNPLWNPSSFHAMLL